jgi:hypothetical protein
MIADGDTPEDIVVVDDFTFELRCGPFLKWHRRACGGRRCTCVLRTDFISPDADLGGH